MVPSNAEAFRKVREQTLAMVDGLSPEQANRRSAPERWSVGELLDHLLRSEALFRREVSELLELKRSGRRPYLSRVLSDFPFGFLDRVPRRVLPLAAAGLSLVNVLVPRTLLRLGLRYTVLPTKAPPVLTPRDGQPIGRLREELRLSIEKTEALFADNADIDFRLLTYEHPLLGVVTALDILLSITAHEQRHQDQLLTMLHDLGVSSVKSSIDEATCTDCR